MFSVCILLYGDHPALAERCLKSIRDSANWPYIQDIRIGLNAVSTATRDVVHEIMRGAPVPRYLYEPEGSQNVLKYPLMRRMFFDDQRPLSSYVMWFDDDSYIREKDRDWWVLVHTHAKQFPLVGSAWFLRAGFRPRQHAGIKAQPWYRGKPIPHNPSFATGGWWTLWSSVIEEWNYPFPELHGNGGDSILGEMIRQLDLGWCRFNTGVAINAGDSGVESSSKRRGKTTAWPWQSYDPRQPADLRHHDFVHTVTTMEE